MFYKNTLGQNECLVKEQRVKQKPDTIFSDETADTQSEMCFSIWEIPHIGSLSVIYEAVTMT